MKSKRVSTTISPKASKMLDEMLATGLWGLNRAQVVREAIYRTLREREVRPILDHVLGRKGGGT